MTSLQDLPPRLASRITLSDSGCWLWGGFINPAGYGRAYLAGKNTTAHRVVWMVLVGEIPDGLQLDHLCRVRNCVNPEHLEPVTPAENSRRSPLWAKPLDVCRSGRHEMTADNIRLNSGGRRQCAACHAEWSRDYKKAWAAANPERTKSHQDAYRERNRGLLRERRAEYYEANRDRIKAARKTDEQRARHRAYMAAYRARKRAAKESTNA